MKTILFHIVLFSFLAIGFSFDNQRIDLVSESVQIQRTDTTHIEVSETVDTFRFTVKGWIRYCSSKYKVPFEVIVGVATRESAFGTSYQAVNHNNWFGIRYYANTYYQGDYYTSSTGRTWRAYDNAYQSIEDFCMYMHEHYEHLIGLPLDNWLVCGYANSCYTPKYFSQFSTFYE